MYQLCLCLFLSLLYHTFLSHHFNFTTLKSKSLLRSFVYVFILFIVSSAVSHGATLSLTLLASVPNFSTAVYLF